MTPTAQHLEWQAGVPAPPLTSWASLPFLGTSSPSTGGELPFRWAHPCKQLLPCCCKVPGVAGRLGLSPQEHMWGHQRERGGGLSQAYVKPTTNAPSPPPPPQSKQT